jgi:hypothetical protein
VALTFNVNRIVKLVALVPVPAPVVTLMGPVDAPVGTVAVICVALSTVNVTALVALNFTSLAPVKFVPVMTTTSPYRPLVGKKLATVGSGKLTVPLTATFCAVAPALV